MAWTMLALLPSASRAQAHVSTQTHYSGQSWSSSSGLPQDTAHQFLESRDGFLWLATEGGLVRFDGNDFTVYDKRSTPGFTSDLINALFEDAGGRLWVATAAGLFERTGASFRRYGAPDGLPSETVWAVGEDHRGRLWVATAAGATMLLGGRFKSVQTGVFDGRLASPITKAADGSLWLVSSSTITRIEPSGKVGSLPLSETATHLSAAPDGSLWLTTAHGLLRCDGHTIVAVPTPKPPLSLAWVARSGDHELWIGTSAGLFLSTAPMRAGDWRPAEKPGDTRHGPPSGSFANAPVTNMFAFPRDTPRTGGSDAPGASRSEDLVAITPAGVAMQRGERFVPVFAQDGFRGEDLLTVYRDREGDLWLGSEAAGVAVLRPGLFTTSTQRDGLPTDQVRSLLAVHTAQEDNLWLGTAAGLTQLRAAKFSTLTTAQGLPSDQILTLAQGNAPDSVWAGTPDGLTYLAGGHAVTLTASDGLPDDTIRSLLLARDHTLWIGTGHGLARLPAADTIQADRLRTWTQADGLGSNTIGSLLEDADGSLWVGTLHGLSHLVAGHIQNYAERDGLTTPIVTALAQGRTGSPLWIGTDGGGLFLRRNGVISRLGTATDYATGRLPSVIYSITEDDTQHLWLGSSTGVYRLNARNLPENAAAEIPIQQFDVSDGLRLQDCISGGHPEAALTASGQLWFATQKGASTVQVHDGMLDRPAPPVSIENASVDDTAVAFDRPFHVPAGHSRLAFHYAGLSFAAPARVRYRYRLDRFDRGWITAGTRRTAYYTNVPPGHYTFRVQASTDGNQWSENAAAVAFTIAPHYYQTWWFYTLVALLLAAVAWQLYLYRLRQVELRFHAVLAERGRIAREIHDTLAQDIVGISVQLELVTRLLTLSVDKAREQLLETRSLVRRSLAQARSSIWDLRSSGSGDLPSRIRACAKDLTANSAATLVLDITGTYRAFSQTAEDELLRIAQEAVTNALRHASPGTIRVSLHYHAAGVRLEVQDDGCGFAPSADRSGPAGHYGIRGMHERAERARGMLEIRSAPGAGTTVVAEAPQENG